MIRFASLVSLAACAVALFSTTTASAQTFSYTPPGKLYPTNAGTGLAETRALADTMRFPIEAAPAYANSQVWGHGGYLLGKGAECDKENFSYPWHDNYCEKRDWDMPLCPGGTGHQGQDIRAASCKDKTHWLVAAVDGTIISASGPGTGIGGYQVLLVGADGTRYRYLHGANVIVKTGQKVKQGERLAMVSREFNGTPTTVHLHFDLMQNVSPHGLVFVSPYMSLVRSYERLLGIADAGAPPPAAADASTDAGISVSTEATEPKDERSEDELLAAPTDLPPAAESDGCTVAHVAPQSSAGSWRWAIVAAVALVLQRRRRRHA